MLKPLDVENAGKRLTVKLTVNFMAICPVDDNPDFYKLEIVFVPGKHTLDIISLRHYLLKYQGQKILAEDLAVTLVNDLDVALSPKMLSMKLTNNAEGIEIEVQQEKK